GQRPQGAPALAIEGESEQSEDELERVEGEPEAEDRHRVEEHDAVYGEEIDQRCGEGQADLEQREVGNRSSPESAFASPPECGTMLPDRLDRSVGPAAALTEEVVQGCRRFGPRDR